MNTKNIIKIAIVGLGRAGWCLHLEQIQKLPQFKIVGVVDPVRERCQEAVQLTGCEAYADIETLLQKTDATLIVVATPSHMHHRDAMLVLSSGRNCIIEKPMGINFKEAQEIVSYSKERNLHVFVHHTQLFFPEYRHLSQVMQSGILGDLFHLRTFWGSYARRWDWQTLKKNGGGQLNNTCPHTLSVVLPLMGSKIHKVYADLRNIKDSGDAEDHVHLALKAENGVTADVVVSSAIAIGIPKWILCCKYGTLISDGKKSRIRYYDPSQVAARPVLDEAAPNREYLSESLPWLEKEIDVETSIKSSFYQNVSEVLLNQRDMIVTPESALDVIRVMEMAEINSKE